MTALGDLFGTKNQGTNAESFLIWGVAFGFAQAILGPLYTEVQELVWQAAIDAGVNLPPSVPDLATMVQKGILTEENAAARAKVQGTDGNDFANQVLNSGQPPGLETVLEMARRGFIPFADAGANQPSVERAILTSNLYSYWVDAVTKLGDPSQPGGGIPLSPADAVDAALRGQASIDWAQVEASFSGLNADRFQIALATAGRPPAVGELVEMVRRGLIPEQGTGQGVLSFQQGIFEGDTKDKWWPLFLRLRDYVPPPRSIATLQSHGVIDQPTATKLYSDNGLTPDLAAIYARSAVATRVTAHTTITENQILKLYHDQLIDAAMAEQMLANLGVEAPVAAYLLELQDFNRVASAYDRAVTRVGALYTAHKIDRASAVTALGALDIPDAARQRLLTVWDHELAVNVKTLTPAEVADALYYQVIDQPTAQAEMEKLGYTPYDAWVVLSVRAHGPLPNPPGGGPAPGEATPTV